MDSSSKLIPPAAKWIQDNDESDNDQVGLVPHNRGYKLKKWASDSQFGGNKLRAPKTLAEETEYIKGGKKRTVVKRKRRRIEDGFSDDEEDPYTLINIEDILSPIELPTDIVRRPALRRILRSRQIDALARTSMEFIEGEKNFNKILCRLSAIMHHDDPRYLDLTFDRTSEQRKKYKEDAAAAAEAAATLSGSTGNSSSKQQSKGYTVVVEAEAEAEEEEEEEDKTAKIETNNDSSMVNALDPKLLNSEIEASLNEDNKEDEDLDVEAREVVKRVKELLLENINYSNEYISRLQGARNKLCKASMQKDTLWKELKSNAKEEDRRNKNYQGRDYN